MVTKLVRAVNHLTLYSIGFFLDHDIFYFYTTLKKKFKKNFSTVLNTFENIMENGANA